MTTSNKTQSNRRIRRQFLTVTLAFAFNLCCSHAFTQQSQTSSPATLRDAAAQAHRLVGAALSAGKLRNSPSFAAVAGREFNYVTPENEMKPGLLEPEQNQFVWMTNPDDNAAEQVVRFAEAHGMKVKGHNLLWHEQYPKWMLQLNAQQIHDAFVNHAHQVVRHFKGRVIAWDVVNEVIDNDNGNQLRVGDPVKYPLYQRLGATDAERRANLYQLIKDVFVAAHQEDPAALLFMNDYSIEAASPKADAVIALAIKLKADGVPIDGVGFQCHLGLNRAPATELAANMKRLTDRGFLVNISEIDISECDAPAGQGDAMQAAYWHDIAAACVANASCNGITAWGIDDKDSWIKTCKNAPGRLPRPLMFDDSFTAKPSYSATMQALLGK